MPVIPMTLSRQLKDTVESHIQSLKFDDMQPANLYEPMAYILSMKGKRIRPILTMLAYHSVSGRSPEEAIDLASAVELFHNFTLMHDDIMDRAPMRRGMPTVHIKWNSDVAILSGDALFAFSMILVVKEFPTLAAPLAKEFGQVAMEVCEGQMEDMDLAQLDTVTIPAYLEMIRKKTAALLGGCMSLGAQAAGATPELVAQYKAYGEALGIAFQLQDDLMDAFPPEGFGKQVGGDIIENKKTYLLLKAKELATPEQLAVLNEWIGKDDFDPQEKVEAVLNIFRQTQIESHTQALIKDYFDKAIELGDQLSSQVNFSPVRSYLQEIAKRQV
ncbi:MAG: polyprenyl synthetase family protein [Bacteroidota bacterium]